LSCSALGAKNLEEIEACVEPHRLILVGKKGPGSGSAKDASVYRVLPLSEEFDPSSVKLRQNGSLLEIEIRKSGVSKNSTAEKRAAWGLSAGATRTSEPPELDQRVTPSHTDTTGGCGVRPFIGSLNGSHPAMQSHFTRPLLWRVGFGYNHSLIASTLLREDEKWIPILLFRNLGCGNLIMSKWIGMKGIAQKSANQLDIGKKRLKASGTTTNGFIGATCWSIQISQRKSGKKGRFGRT
jgi:hypothetical protein